MKLEHHNTYTKEFSINEINKIDNRFINTTLKELFHTVCTDIKIKTIKENSSSESYFIRSVIGSVKINAKAEARNSYSKSGGRKTFNTERIIHRTDLDNINTILSDLINELHYKANTDKLEHLIIPETIRLVVKLRVDVTLGVKYIVNTYPL